MVFHMENKTKQNGEKKLREGLFSVCFYSKYLLRFIFRLYLIWKLWQFYREIFFFFCYFQEKNCIQEVKWLCQCYIVNMRQNQNLLFKILCTFYDIMLPSKMEGNLTPVILGRETVSYQRTKEVWRMYSVMSSHSILGCLASER